MKRILIVKLSSMGDVLHAMPVLSDIKQALGKDIHIDWVTEPNYACLLKDHPYIHQLHTLPLRKYKSFFKAVHSKEAKQLKQYLKQNPYDAVLDLQGLLKSAWVCRWAKGKRFGYNAKSIREPWASLFYQHKIAVSKDLHAITRMRELAAQALGYDVPTETPNYLLNISQPPINTPLPEIKDFDPPTRGGYEPSSIDKHINKEDGRYRQLILFPFTTWESKHWPLENWLTLTQLTKEQFNIFIAWGSQDEYRQAQSLCKNIPNCQPTPDLNIEGMKNFLENCDAFVGVDTGFAHLATAMDLPGVMLMGPTDKNKSGPLGKNQIALDVNLPCRPCHKRTCSLPVEANTLRPQCLAMLSPHLILKNLQQIL